MSNRLAKLVTARSSLALPGCSALQPEQMSRSEVQCTGPRGLCEHNEWSFPMRKIATALLIGVSLMISACNTVKGVGEDIESVGEAGDKAI